LFLNTLGGVIGFIIAPIFTYFLPKTNELDSHIDLETKPVGNNNVSKYRMEQLIEH